MFISANHNARKYSRRVINFHLERSNGQIWNRCQKFFQIVQLSEIAI